MKKKIKLRDMTEEQFFAFKNSDSCIKKSCDDCPFHYTSCSVMERCWAKHKDIYSDKFLDQEVEIEVPDILTKEERDYLKAVIAPFRERVGKIEKLRYDWANGFLRIGLTDIAIGSLCMPSFNMENEYVGMKENKLYTLEDLGL